MLNCFPQPLTSVPVVTSETGALLTVRRGSVFASGAGMFPEQGVQHRTFITVGINFLLHECQHLFERHCFRFPLLCPSKPWPPSLLALV